jgi:uncharacterized protein (TIGR02246 family)
MHFRHSLMKSHLFLFLMLGLGTLSSRAATGAEPEIAAATRAWTDAFASHDADRIAALYAPDAIFWGTNSALIRNTPELVRAYFVNLKNRPTVRIELDEQNVRVYGDVAVNTGRYSVHEVKDGQPTVRPLRFSFVYRKVDGRWLIVDHHSSAMPAP